MMVLRCTLICGGITGVALSQEREPSLTINVLLTGGQKEDVPSYLNGFRAAVSGQTISYHSSHPDAETALLCRVRSDAGEITWETDTLPESFPGTSYRFVWLAGIERIGWGNTSHPHTFHLSVNGDRWFTFTNRKDSTAAGWTIRGNEGAELTFESRYTDRFGDLFGYMYMSLPKRSFQAGVPLVLRVDGEDANSPEWYMTFQY
ncbi:MAG TPA: hypothetical protein VGR15_04285, partial [Bacteroidota bacterium]|nr:hypothetical protein [Bacteroidota bacterium]